LALTLIARPRRRVTGTAEPGRQTSCLSVADATLVADDALVERCAAA
jgi:hypothetical protein